MPFSKILVAYDGSDLSRLALDKAMEMSKEGSAKLEIIHVYQLPIFLMGEGYYVPPIDVQSEAVNAAQAVSDELEGITSHLPGVNIIVKQGQAAKQILDYAEQESCDLIVMGSRGLGGIQEFVLGSVSHNVVQHAKVPVLVVK